MPGVCPKGSGDRSWPRWGSAFSLCGDSCFILRHSSHFLVQRRHFSNPQTEWVLGARRRALRSTRCLTASFSARPAHEACPVPSSRWKEWPRPEGRVGTPPPPAHCLQNRKDAEPGIFPPESDAATLLCPADSHVPVQTELENLLLYSRNFAYLLRSGTSFSGGLKPRESWEHLLLEN